MTDTCPRCDARIVAIRMEIDGRPVTMRSCNRCELRTWESDGTSINLTGVLDLAQESARSR